MVPQISLLVLLVDLIDAIPSPTSERKRGRPLTYPDRLFLKALVIMLARDVHTVDGLVVMVAITTSRAMASAVMALLARRDLVMQVQPSTSARPRASRR